MDMSMNVKAYLKNGDVFEIRRFCIDGTSATNFTLLKKKISEIFPSLNGSANFTLHWKDEEDDLVSFSSEEELLQALSSIKDGLFRVYIKEETAGDVAKTVHENVVCDVCDQGVVGIRYKCAVCPDYDLCSVCEAKGLHAEHHMIRMCSSVQERPTPQMWDFPRFLRRHCRQFWRHQQQQRRQAAPAAPGGAAPPPSSEEASEEAAMKMQQEEFLKSVGNSVASMLDPLGIDVQVDVEDDQQQRQRCHGYGGGHGRGGGRGCRRGGHPRARWGGKGTCEMACDKKETKGETKDGGEATSGGNGSDGSDEWTVVSDKAESPPKPPVLSETGGRLYPHPNPKVVDAMQHLLSMGYTDENGWLTHLVESKEGDVNGVLDSLKPTTAK